MVSESKIRANRANARASTGPNTAEDRARSAQNAFRHGLSLPINSMSAELEAIAREIAGPDANSETQELARRVAEAQIDVRRARYARHRFLSTKMEDPYYERRAETRKKLGLLRRAIPYLLRPNPPEKLEEWLGRYLVSTPQGPIKFTTILSEECRNLLALDRYEQRALSRRKFAIRAFDEARQRSLRTQSGNSHPSFMGEGGAELP